MRRLLSVLFTLHFCVSIGIFALGGLCDASPASCVKAATATVELDELAAQIDGADHGLTDGHADLPEFIASLQTVATTPLAPVYGARVQSERNSPSLAGLQRPPIRQPLS